MVKRRKWKEPIPAQIFSRGRNLAKSQITSMKSQIRGLLLCYPLTKTEENSLRHAYVNLSDALYDWERKTDDLKGEK